MALNSKATVAVAVMAAVVLMMFAGEASALTCGDVDSKLAQCVSYATGRVSSLSAGCCNGVRGLNALANNTPNRQMACKCLKSLANSIKSIDMGKVSAVPGKCGVSVPFPISMSTDCNKDLTRAMLSVGGDVPVNSEAPVVTSSSSRYAGPVYRRCS